MPHSHTRAGGNDLAILDCESYESALMSIAGFYGIGTSELGNFLHRFDLDSDLGGSEELLRARFELSFGVDHEDMESVCWFHITRVPQGVIFAEESCLCISFANGAEWSKLMKS